MKQDKLQAILLGVAQDAGVPQVGCLCKNCNLARKDNGKRHLVTCVGIVDRTVGKSWLMDCTPDFRQQMLISKISRIDAVLFTHEHKDHVAGLDDIRAYNFIQKKPINIYCSDNVFTALKREYRYIFDDTFRYPGIPKINRNW